MSLLIFFVTSPCGLLSMVVTSHVLCSLMPEGEAHIDREQKSERLIVKYCASVCVNATVSWK